MGLANEKAHISQAHDTRESGFFIADLRYPNLEGGRGVEQRHLSRAYSVLRPDID